MVRSKLFQPSPPPSLYPTLQPEGFVCCGVAKDTSYGIQQSVDAVATYSGCDVLSKCPKKRHLPPWIIRFQWAFDKGKFLNNSLNFTEYFSFSASNALTGEGLSEGVEWLTGMIFLSKILKLFRLNVCLCDGL